MIFLCFGTGEQRARFFASLCSKVHTAQDADDCYDGTSRPCFVSHCSEALQAWNRSEESYTEAVATYAKKQVCAAFVLE